MPLAVPPATSGGALTVKPLLFNFPDTVLSRLVDAIPRPRLDLAISLSESLPFVSLAAEFLREKGIDSGNPSVIRGAVKVEFLEFLSQRGLCGLHKFLHTFISSLIKKSKPQHNPCGTAAITHLNAA